jgi:hypothetical protein
LPRIASFIATSNRKDLLTDPTGSRRFLCVEVDNAIDLSPIEHDQVYAQLKAELAAGLPHWFTKEEEKMIMENNAPFRRQDPEEDVFHTCFRLPLEGEKGLMLSGVCIFNALKKASPSIMRSSTAHKFSQSLTALGVARIHTRNGNLYHVVPLLV